MPRLNKYQKRKAQLGGMVQMTPEAVKKAEEKAEQKIEKRTEEEMKEYRRQLFRAWTRF